MSLGLRIKKSCSNLAAMTGEWDFGGRNESFATSRVSSKNSIDSLTEQAKRHDLLTHDTQRARI